MPLRKIFFTLFIVASFVSCKKEAGDGGLATIEGHLYENLYDPLGVYIEQAPASDESVYLIYGTNATYDDKTDTDADGKYQFKGLLKGDYTVFAFSECISCASGSIEIEESVEITAKKATTAASDLVVTKNLDYDGGTSSIQGIIEEIDYTVSPVGPAYAETDRYVYIVLGSGAGYFDRVKTDGSGAFLFANLVKGSYRVYTFSDCLSCSGGTEERDATTLITVNGETVDVGTITRDKR